MGFPGGSEGKESACNVGDPGSIPALGRSPGEENGNPLQYTCLENSMNRGAWQATVHGVAKSRTWLSDFTFPEIKNLASLPFPGVHASFHVKSGTALFQPVFSFLSLPSWCWSHSLCSTFIQLSLDVFYVPGLSLRLRAQGTLLVQTLPPRSSLLFT